MWLFKKSKGVTHSIVLLLVSVHTRMISVESFAAGNLYRHSVQQQHQQQQQSRSKPAAALVVESRTRLYASSSSSSKIRFLGRGPNAIVREGVVLLPPADEFHHYLRQSAVFIYSMGLDDEDEYVIRGVILDNPTPFSIGEMMEVPPPDADAETDNAGGGIFDNLIYRGGESGGQEAVFCLHSVGDTMGLEEIGTSSVYQGGDLEALNTHDPSKVKFFFNYMEFLEQELEDMLEIVHEDGDGWTSVEVPPEMVLNSDSDKSEVWSRLRNAVRGK